MRRSDENAARGLKNFRSLGGHPVRKEFRSILNDFLDQTINAVGACLGGTKVQRHLAGGREITIRGLSPDSAEFDAAIELVEEVSQRVLRSDRVLRLADLKGREEGSTFELGELMLEQVLGIPIKLKGGSSGVMVLGYTSPGDIRPILEEQWIDHLAACAGMVIDISEACIEEKLREEQVELICEVSRNLAELRSLDELIPRIVRTVRETFAYDAVSLLLARGDKLLVKDYAAGKEIENLLGFCVPITDQLRGGIVGHVASSGEPLLTRDVRSEKRYMKAIEDTKSELAVPLKIRDRIIGVLDVESFQVDGLDKNDQLILEALGDQIAIAMENARLYEELRAARDEIEVKACQLKSILSRTVAIQEDERKRIATDIHDGITQLLVGALYEMQAGKANLASGPNGAKEKLARAQELVSKSIDEMHRIIYDLRPPMAGETGLVYALGKLASTFLSAAGIESVFEVQGEPYGLGPEREIAVYRIVQEGLQNIVKHAQATSVHMSLRFAPSTVVLTLEDDGQGFTIGRAREIVGEQLGLISMEERAANIGGQLTVDSAPGCGTVVSLELPGRQLEGP